MDNKTIFVRTSKGEEQVQSRTSHLSGDVKRALSMVDGIASFGEISKRSAPSMRANLAEMFEELEKSGLIQDKSFAGKIPTASMPPQMVVPVKKVSGELDFMSGYAASSRQAPAAVGKADKLRAEAEEISKREIEAEKLRAQQEAEAILRKAEEEARLRLEAAERERKEAEVARLKAELEAKRMRDELEAAKLKAEQEARLRLEAAEKERKEAEAARVKAEQEAKRVRDEVEAAKRKAEQEARLRLEAAERERKEAEAARAKAEQEAARVKAEQEAKARLDAELNTAANARSTSMTVLFFDVVGYTKQSVSKQIEIKRQFNQLVSECLKPHDTGEYIILDTGDGAAIGFPQYPEEALEVAVMFRKTAMANHHMDYPDLKVRMGIHLGPVNIAKDMNGRSNMVGDGINDAQRVMSFAGVDRIYISRAYYDYVSRLNDEYSNMLLYRGMQKDKHGREHAVYELMDSASAEQILRKQAGDSGAETQSNPFSFDSFEFEHPPSTSGPHEVTQPASKTGSEKIAHPFAKQDAFALDSFKVEEPAGTVGPQKAQRPGETATPTHPDDASKSAARSVTQPAASEAAERKPGKENKTKEQLEREVKARIAEETRAKEMADAQAKVWAEAEQRALESAKANAARVAVHAEQHAETALAEKSVRAARAPRKPFAWGKLGGIVLMLGTFLLVLLVGALFVVPYFLPMRDYMPKVQQLLSDELHQPVHLGYLSGRILPTPRLDLGEIYIGDAKQFQAATAQINFDITGVFTDNKPIDSIDFQKVTVRGIALRDSAAWLQKLAGDPQYPVKRMTISEGTLDADAFQLTGVEGELKFNPAGKFTHANLSANSGKYTVGIDAAPGDKLMAAITVRGSALPLLPNWTFDELEAKSEISSDGLLISDFEAKIMGGNLQGNARIDWHSGWHAEGTLNAKNVVMRDLNKLLDGNVDGSAHFKMNSKDLAGLTDSAEMEGSFTSAGGLISGMDIVETARKRSSENLPGGRTHYDGLSGGFTYADNAYHFTQVKISAGVLNANATFAINKQQLSGKMKVNLALHDVTSTELQLGGAIDDPTLVYVP